MRSEINCIGTIARPRSEFKSLVTRKFHTSCLETPTYLFQAPPEKTKERA